MRQGECAASWAPARGVRRRGEVGKVRLREANVLETSMLCLFYYLRGPVVLVFRIYKDRISIIKWKRWSRFAHPETTAMQRSPSVYPADPPPGATSIFRLHHHMLHRRITSFTFYRYTSTVAPINH